jgi:hypothetical protein
MLDLIEWINIKCRHTRISANIGPIQESRNVTIETAPTNVAVIGPHKPTVRNLIQIGTSYCNVIECDFVRSLVW